MGYEEGSVGKLEGTVHWHRRDEFKSIGPVRAWKKQFNPVSHGASVVTVEPCRTASDIFVSTRFLGSTSSLVAILSGPSAGQVGRSLLEAFWSGPEDEGRFDAKPWP